MIATHISRALGSFTDLGSVSRMCGKPLITNLRKVEQARSARLVQCLRYGRSMRGQTIILL